MASPNLRVLLAEQEFSETGLTLRALCAEQGWGLEMVFVGNRTALGHALTTHCPDVAFLQLALLQPGAPALLRLLHHSFPAVPFILFADPADTDCAVSCLSMGAQDFMLEGFMDSRTMARALRSAMGAPSLPDSTENYPPQLPNSRPERFASEAKHNVAATLSVSEPAGDSAVSASTERDFERLLCSVIRSTDVVVRLRPGQWLVQFPGVSETSLSRILPRLQTNLAAFRPQLPTPAHFELSVSVDTSAHPCEPALRTASPDLRRPAP